MEVTDSHRVVESVLLSLLKALLFRNITENQERKPPHLAGGILRGGGSYLVGVAG